MLNTAVQYVHKLDSSCFRPPLSSSSTSFSDCYESWQTCPAAVLVGAIYFKTQICSGLYVCVCACRGVRASACFLWSIHPLTRTDPPLTSPSLAMTGGLGCDPLQSLFCSPNLLRLMCSAVSTAGLSDKVMLQIVRT